MGHIKQIITANPGWRVAYSDSDEQDGFFTQDVACWALVRNEDGSQSVYALLPTPDSSLEMEDEKAENCFGVYGPSTTDDDLKGFAKQKLKEYSGPDGEPGMVPKPRRRPLHG